MKQILLFFCLLPLALEAQEISGEWFGKTNMEGSEEVFSYRLYIEEQDGNINGTSISATLDSSEVVNFQVIGSRQGEKVIIQEIIQLNPKTPEWCLKYSNLDLVVRNDSLLLFGDWKGGDCNPGKVYLYKAGSAGKTETIIEEVPFSFVGVWTGHLDQSDRAYGFFYELELEEDGTGASYIVSEGSGGSAYHELTWKFDPKAELLIIEEEEVLEKTDPKWKWCIKSAHLQLSEGNLAYQLQGNWTGHIEEDYSESGKCAPGTVYLEKAKLTRTIVKQIKEKSSTYESKIERKIKINRILEVKRPELKIGVWDNGVLDGDVMTLFINGKKYLENYRVGKRKAYIDVQLKEKNNFLILHADDLGKISPNTVALSIYDGHKEQTIVMSSNLKESGAILIKRVDLK